MTDVVKRQVAAHWDRRAPHFDEDFGHSIRTSAERAAWDRLLHLVLPAGRRIDALDAGCGTGFLTFELVARGHHVIGVDFAPAMIEEARRKSATLGVTSVRFEEADAEQLPFMPASFDLVISRHLLWTLPHPEAAIDEWIRVLRPGGRLVVVDGQFDAGAAAPPGSARSSAEYAAVGDQLPFLGGRSMEQIEALFQAHGLVHVSGDPLFDLVAAQAQRMVEEGRERRTHRRYVVWGDLAR